MNCPNCGSEPLCEYEKHINFKRIDYLECHNCGWRSDRVYVSSQEGKNEQDPNNPYTDFAKEMSLLRGAMRDADFKGDMLTDILVKMSPIVWDKLQAKNREEEVNKTIAERLEGIEDKYGTNRYLEKAKTMLFNNPDKEETK